MILNYDQPDPAGGVIVFPDVPAAAPRPLAEGDIKERVALAGGGPVTINVGGTADHRE